MKKELKLWLVASLGLTLAVGAVGCQEDGAPAASVTTPESAGGGLLQAGDLPMPLLHRLDRKLNLTTSQHAAVFAILKREREAMVASGVFAQGREAVRAAMEARREKVGDEIAGLLTAEQKTTFDALRSRIRERMAGGFGRGEMLTRELGLSAAQQEQLKGMLEARRGTFHEVRQALRAGTLNRAELRQKARAGREAFRTELEGILTPEQRTHFRQMVEEWKKDFQK